MNKKSYLIIFIHVIIMTLAFMVITGKAHAEDTNSVSQSISQGANAGLAKLSVLESKSTEIAAGDLPPIFTPA